MSVLGQAAVGSGTSQMQSLHRGLLIIETVAETQPIGVGELSRRVQLPKSTVQRILVALQDAGWLKPVGQPPRWQATAKVHVIARKVTREVGLRQAALVAMRSLNEATRETIFLSVFDGVSGTVLIDRFDSPQPVRTSNELGALSPVHATSSGRAILAYLSEEQVTRVIEGGLERLTERTIVDPDLLRAELARTRDRGYAVNIAENRSHVCALAAPIFDANSVPVASVAISMPDIRYDESRREAFAVPLLAAAQTISANMRR